MRGLLVSRPRYLQPQDSPIVFAHSNGETGAYWSSLSARPVESRGCFIGGISKRHTVKCKLLHRMSALSFGNKIRRYSLKNCVVAHCSRPPQCGVFVVRHTDGVGGNKGG